MTIAEFLSALKTKVSVSIIQDGEVILEVKNADGVAEKLSADVSGATIESIDIIGSMSVCVTIEKSEP